MNFNLKPLPVPSPNSPYLFLSPTLPSSKSTLPSYKYNN